MVKGGNPGIPKKLPNYSISRNDGSSSNQPQNSPPSPVSFAMINDIYEETDPKQVSQYENIKMISMQFGEERKETPLWMVWTQEKVDQRMEQSFPNIDSVLHKTSDILIDQEVLCVKRMKSQVP